MDNKECGEAKDRKPPGVGYHFVVPVGQSFSLGNLEEELHETREQRSAKVVDVLSSADAVSVLRPEEDVAKLLWMVSADEVAAQLGEVLALDVKAFAVPRAGWAEAFQQFGIPKGHTGPAEEMFESVNARWMDLGIAGMD